MLPPLPGTPEPLAMPRLCLKPHSRLCWPSTHIVISGEVTIGRHPSCDFVIPDLAYVSGEHCRVIACRVDDGLEVVDLSLNGTYVNGARLELGVRTRLERDDKMSLNAPRSDRLEYFFVVAFAPSAASPRTPPPRKRRRSP
jgi:hypothetical protein